MRTIFTFYVAGDAFPQSTFSGAIGEGVFEDDNRVINKGMRGKRGKWGKWKEMEKRSERGRMAY